MSSLSAPTNDRDNAAAPTAAAATALADDKGKGKGKVKLDDAMDEDDEDEDDEDDEEDEEGEDEDEDSMGEEDEFAEIDAGAILPPGRRTRGVRVDYTSAEALQKAGPENGDADGDDDQEFVAADSQASAASQMSTD